MVVISNCFVIIYDRHWNLLIYTLSVNDFAMKIKFISVVVLICGRLPDVSFSIDGISGDRFTHTPSVNKMI